jgi:hypothetical protein
VTHELAIEQLATEGWGLHVLDNVFIAHVLKMLQAAAQDVLTIDEHSAGQLLQLALHNLITLEVLGLERECVGDLSFLVPLQRSPLQPMQRCRKVSLYAEAAVVAHAERRLG